MKRALALLVGGVLILGSALAAHAQAPTVSFGGQMRVYGFAYNNITDFTDSGPNGANRDSGSFYFQRWRLWTNVESADKKAKAVWGLEVGDITWGQGGGASGGEFRGCPGKAPFVPVVTVPSAVTTTAATAATAATVTQPGSNTRTGNGAGGCLGDDGVERGDQARVHLDRHGAVGAELVDHARYPGSHLHERPPRSVLRR